MPIIMKFFIIALGIPAVMITGLVGCAASVHNERQATTSDHYKDAEYVIDGQRVRLHDGVAETASASESASKITTRHFGNEVTTDLDSDGRADVVFLLTQESGGSGTFFYVVAALNTGEGYLGSQGYLLGDRIAPQATELSQDPRHKNVIVVSFADRAPGEPMSAQPSIAKNVLLKLDPDSLSFGVVEQDFEGEADPARMSLTMKDWTWISALYSAGRQIEPSRPDLFTLSFTEDGRFSATTDCNQISGGYVAVGKSISFGKIAATRMFCEGSQEAEFLALLNNVQLYHFTSRGELIFDLKRDGGTAIFR
ncbi:META domain-containing protein [Marinobacter sp. BW6]|uniref:META domain-containing protein n=1 Tax=Marinobacter sp. BW6 TaxID=2592624 RepID=UPI0011DE85BF|nr:META domain-containing protein [Marinobacter sp. BW6]TYC62499.1 META domain-containing protein [Marinobacter sp. BW6]